MSHELLHQLGGATLLEVMDIPPPPPMFDGLPLRDKSVTSLVSEPHAMKSMLCLAAAIAEDFHLPLFGKFLPVRTDHRPLFVSVDGADWDMGLMARKLMIGYGLTPEQRKLCTIAGRWKEGLRITDPKFWDPNKPHDSWLWKWHEEVGFTHLIIDTKRAATLVDENNSQQAQMIQDLMKSIRSTFDVAVWFTHHSAINANSKDAGRSKMYSGRGSSADPGAVDFQVNLSRVKRRLYLEWTKARGGFTTDLEYVELVDVETTERDPAGREIKGLRFTAPGVGRDDFLMSVFIRCQVVRRGEFIEHLKSQAHVFLPGSTEAQQVKFADNWLQSQRGIGALKTDGKGSWSRTQESE